MSVSIKDIAPKKYWTILLIVTVISMVFVSQHRIYPEYFPESVAKSFISFADMAKYIGILLVLATSVTWTWRQHPKPNPITPKYQKNLDEKYVWYIIRAFKPTIKWPKLKGQKLDFEKIIGNKSAEWVTHDEPVLDLDEIINEEKKK